MSGHRWRVKPPETPPSINSVPLSIRHHDRAQMRMFSLLFFGGGEIPTWLFSFLSCCAVFNRGPHSFVSWAVCEPRASLFCRLSAAVYVWPVRVSVAGGLAASRCPHRSAAASDCSYPRHRIPLSFFSLSLLVSLPRVLIKRRPARSFAPPSFLYDHHLALFFVCFPSASQGRRLTARLLCSSEGMDGGGWWGFRLCVCLCVRHADSPDRRPLLVFLRPWFLPFWGKLQKN